MKLRIRGNSIRLRLLKSEVASLAADGIVSESVEFGETSLLTYRIVSADSAEAVSVSFENNTLTVTLPRPEAVEWAETDRVGIETECGALGILIEKDFVCLTRTDDPDNRDAYPNPELVCT